MKNLRLMALALALSLSTLPLSASVALAEDTTVTTNTTSTADTTSAADTSTTSTTATTTDTTTTTTATNSNTTSDTTATTDPATNTDGTAAQTTSGDTTSNTSGDPTQVVDENGNVVDPGVLPDSPFYWLTQLIDKLQVILTTDPAKKAALLEDQALEKVAEAEAMAQSGKTEEVQAAMNGYSQKLAEAQAFLTELGKSDSETMQKLELALSQTNAKNIQTLGGLLDKLPPQASEKVALNIVRSMEKSIAKMEKKDQLKLAKELKKATGNIDEETLTEEEQSALDTLDQTIQAGTPETTVAAASDAKTMSTMTAPVSKETAKVTGNEKNKYSDRVKEAASTDTVQPEVQKSNPEVNLPTVAETNKELAEKQKEQNQEELKENNSQKDKGQGSTNSNSSDHGSSKGSKGR